LIFSILNTILKIFRLILSYLLIFDFFENSIKNSKFHINFSSSNLQTLKIHRYVFFKTIEVQILTKFDIKQRITILVILLEFEYVYRNLKLDNGHVVLYFNKCNEIFKISRLIHFKYLSFILLIVK